MQQRLFLKHSLREGLRIYGKPDRIRVVVLFWTCHIRCTPAIFYFNTYVSVLIINSVLFAGKNPPRCRVSEMIKPNCH